MKHVVYIDVLFIINFFVDYILLLLGSKFMHSQEKRWRMLLGAAAGGIYSVLIFFTPDFSFLTSSLIKLVASIVIVAISYKATSVRSFLKGVACFYGATFAFTGILIAIWFTLKPNGLLLNNGAVYFNVSSLTLILSAVAAYLGISLFTRFLKRNVPKECRFELVIQKNGKEITGTALMDTGNSLTDGFSDTPVIVAAYHWIEPLVPEKMRPCFCGPGLLDGNSLTADFPIRLIPAKTVAGTKLLSAFLPDRVEITQNKKSRLVKNVVVAVTDEPIGNGEFEALLPSIICN